MKAIFISDAHLRNSGDKRYKKLINFFDAVKEGKIYTLVNSDSAGTDKKLINDLYITGDLFDFWFCTKEKINPEFKPVIDKLIEMQKAGVHIHLSEGNHDFFMGEYFHDVLGMKVYEETNDAKLDNLNVLIAHGDTADSSNTVYLFFRKVLRSRAFYNFQRFVPASIRWALAGFFSTTSKKLTIENGNVLLKKMSPFALARFQQGYDVVILGHCHVPSINYYTIKDTKRIFATPGDWMTHYSFLYYENNKFSLHYYRQ
ncbi:MAG: UDP-2,3-diacylglucosamine diphosphatase [Syntrophaceae bacterium]|nr:UDP-2,3-diacylglucosamine diphosphatase [Syntrophaceae bacterium]